jgi:Domain of unknown function (DUF4258)
MSAAPNRSRFSHDALHDRRTHAQCPADPYKAHALLAKALDAFFRSLQLLLGPHDAAQ